MNLLHEYVNGNYTVKLYENGTKERIYESDPNPVYPESIDVKITDYCDANCAFCFHPESIVMMTDGNKPINSIKIGDSICSYDEKESKLESSIVENIIINYVNEELLVIELENKNIIKCTSDHEIFTKNRGWIKAMHLNIDDEMCENAFYTFPFLKTIRIKSLTFEKYVGAVYDLTVSKNHNYFVSNCLVHNCHEKSTTKGTHSDEDFLKSLFNGLPSGVELAIGGGNPLSFPGIYRVLNRLGKNGLVCNMTINSVHIRKNKMRILDMIDNKLIHGVGISYFPVMHNYCMEMVNYSNNAVFHIIMGVHTIHDLNRIIRDVEKPKVLLLGYKQYGRGEQYYNSTIKKILYEWYTHIHTFFNTKNLTLSFDNLGIKQLKLHRFFSNNNWSKFYMGDDGRFTMYIDAVNKQYAVSSTSNTRFDIGNSTVTQMFKHIRTLTDQPIKSID